MGLNRAPGAGFGHHAAGGTLRPQGDGEIEINGNAND
jgi:hypothetical protein